MEVAPARTGRSVHPTEAHTHCCQCGYGALCTVYGVWCTVHCAFRVGRYGKARYDHVVCGDSRPIFQSQIAAWRPRQWCLAVHRHCWRWVTTTRVREPHRNCLSCYCDIYVIASLPSTASVRAVCRC
jgi:hypothetical protein